MFELSGNIPITPTRVVVTLASTGIFGVLLVGMLSVASDARIAIEVAKQHGEELLMIRGELSAIRTEMIDRTALRYTSRDADQHEKYMDRRFEAMESRIEDLAQ